MKVTNARLVIPEMGVVTGTLVVRDGRVAEIIPGTGSAERGHDVIDADGRFVLPGFIDPHVHFGLVPPLAAHLRSESGFAATGGVTTVLRYYRRPESYLETMPDQVRLSNEQSYQDFAIHLALLTAQQVTELPRYAEELGVTSFKLYMNLKGALGKNFFMDVLADGRDERAFADVDCTDGHVYSVFQEAARATGRVRISVHSEDAEIVRSETERVRGLGFDGLVAWHAARPGASEAIAIGTVAYLSRRFRVPVYFPHIGSREAIEALVDARRQGTDFVAETGPQYLALNAETAPGMFAKVMPPVRTADDAEEVWRAVAGGLLSTLGSDHIVRMSSEKQGSIWEAAAAFGGTGLILPVLLSEGLNRGRVTIRQVAELGSWHAAKAFGLYPRKGTLLPGSDADFVIVDTEREWTVRAADLAAASDFSVFEGRTLRGAVDVTAVRGQVVYRDGQLVGAPGHGHYLFRGGSRGIVPELEMATAH